MLVKSLKIGAVTGSAAAMNEHSENFFGSLRQFKANEPAENKVLISTVLSVRLKYAPPYPPDPLRPQKRIQNPHQFGAITMTTV